jgi:hypothetical protein
MCFIGSYQFYYWRILVLFNDESMVLCIEGERPIVYAYAYSIELVYYEVLTQLGFQEGYLFWEWDIYSSRSNINYLGIYELY